MKTASIIPMAKPLTRLVAFLARPGLALFGCFLFLSLTLTSRERAWSDATPIYEVAESLVGHFGIDIKTRWPAGQAPGRDGKFYDVHPLLPALVHVPGVMLQTKLGKAWPDRKDSLRAFCCHIGPAALGALTCALFFHMVRRRLRVAARPALLSAVGLALGTCVWVYARSPYSEIVQIASYAALLTALLAAHDRPGIVTGIWVGAAAGMLLNSKVVYAVSLPGAAVLLAIWLRRDWRTLLRMAAGGLVGMAPFLVMLLWYNHARWSSETASGYTATGYPVAVATFYGSVVTGLVGMFLSPGKSIFLYCPLLVLGILGLPALARRHPFALWAVLVTAAPPVLVSATLVCWSGDYAWGPRYLVFALPGLALPAAMFVEQAFMAASRRERAMRMAAVGAAVTAGLAVNLLGSALYWDHFLRMARQVAPQWLGTPIKMCFVPGLPQLVPGNCESCLEDMYPVMWLPPFQPIRGHWWLAKHVVARHTWMEAAVDAPWRHYTVLPIDIAFSYERGRIDWWRNEWKAFPKFANRLLAGLIAMTVICGAFLVIGWRRLPGTRRESPSQAPAQLE